jgi:hypothetical protein
MEKRAAIYLSVLSVFGCLCEVALSGAAREKKVVRIDAEKIRGHVKYLASDALEGRGTGQKGGDAAADYLAAQFKSMDWSQPPTRALTFRACRW